MPRPKSSISIEWSSKQVMLIKFPKPSRVSSIELDSISKTECSQPSIPSEPKITAGLFLTLSAPFREDMLSFP
jgi:hypothetical protein